ncbi:unnamed protein product [Ilex paraguariensis]|uniref:Uncharacterized protein n=1 Tax=Ilex paraguariensis TaxID=185542 RepID=A0ABC8SDU8_9AQUA
MADEKEPSAAVLRQEEEDFMFLMERIATTILSLSLCYETDGVWWRFSLILACTLCIVITHWLERKTWARHDKLPTPVPEEGSESEETMSPKKKDAKKLWYEQVATTLLLMFVWRLEVGKTSLAILTLIFAIVDFVPFVMYFHDLFLEEYEEDAHGLDEKEEDSKEESAPCDSVEEVAKESDETNEDFQNDSLGKNFDTLKIKHDQTGREIDGLINAQFECWKAYPRKEAEWKRKLEEAMDEHKDNQLKWEEERKSLVVQLGATAESSKAYHDLSQDYEENRRKWEEEKNNLVAKICAANASAELYQGLLNDLGY